MKKFIITLLCLAIIVGGSYGGYLQFQKSKDEKRIVDVIPVSMMNQELYNETRMTDARVTSGSVQNVELSTQKLMKEVCVKLGDKVKKGDTILVYDMTVVELENEKNKNQIAVIEQEIKEQEQELRRLQTLQPSENAPKNETTTTRSETKTTTTTKKTTTTSRTTTKKSSVTQMLKPVFSETTTKQTTRKTTTKKPEPEPVSVRTELSSLDNPDGYELDGASYFRCVPSTSVTSAFMQQVIERQEHVIIYVYDDEHKKIQYFWVLDGSGETKLQPYDWHAGDDVSSKYGSFVYTGAGDGRCGMFVVYVPEVNENYDDGGDDDYDDYDDFGGEDDGGDIDFGGDGEDIDIPAATQPPVNTAPPAGEEDPTEIDGGDEEIDLSNDSSKERVIDVNDLDDGDTVEVEDTKDDSSSSSSEEKKPVDENYMYSRADLVEKVKEAQLDLKEKQLELRKAELLYKAGLKQKEDGKVIAQIDGIVTRLDNETTSIGAAMGEYSEEEEFVDYDAAYDGTDMVDDSEIDDGEDHPYIVIQGKANVSLDINVPEMSLSKFEKGTIVSGTDYSTGKEFTAVVTGRKDDPVSYRSMSDDNPNSSTYIVTADVRDCPSLAIDEYVQITIPDKEVKKTNKNTLNIPIRYVRKEAGSYYVMLADENGLLKKRYVKTGKIHYGELIEVLSGLSIDDRICFPYGKDVKEGVKTRESEEFFW